TEDAKDLKKVANAIAEYAIECSVNKFFASEVLSYVVDEGVQIHGGYGFMQEYPIERAYRDARINRIFEGTNEINRLLIPGTLVKRVVTGALPLLDFVTQVRAELAQGGMPAHDGGPLAAEADAVEAAKRLTAHLAGLLLE